MLNPGKRWRPYCTIKSSSRQNFLVPEGLFSQIIRSVPLGIWTTAMSGWLSSICGIFGNWAMPFIFFSRNAAWSWRFCRCGKLRLSMRIGVSNGKIFVSKNWFVKDSWSDEKFWGATYSMPFWASSGRISFVRQVCWIFKISWQRCEIFSSSAFGV